MLHWYVFWLLDFEFNCLTPHCWFIHKPCQIEGFLRLQKWFQRFKAVFFWQQKALPGFQHIPWHPSMVVALEWERMSGSEGEDFKIWPFRWWFLFSSFLFFSHFFIFFIILMISKKCWLLNDMAISYFHRSLVKWSNVTSIFVLVGCFNHQLQVRIFGDCSA